MSCPGSMALLVSEVMGIAAQCVGSSVGSAWVWDECFVKNAKSWTLPDSCIRISGNLHFAKVSLMIAEHTEVFNSLF